MSDAPQVETPKHFKGKDAIGHVAEAQAQGILSAAEIHGTEMSGHMGAGTDAARETALVLLLLWVSLVHLTDSFQQIFVILAIFSVGWLIWKIGRSAWLAWSHLERMHRIVDQERWEIEHHRQQERDELRVLYATKGFEGKLLEDVLDVLMADNERLLRVMVEEELGLSLEKYEHPLKQSLGAAIGTCCAIAVCLAAFFIYPSLGLMAAALIALGVAAGIAAYFEQNRLIPAIIWNIGLAILAFGVVYFLFEYFFK